MTTTELHDAGERVRKSLTSLLEALESCKRANEEAGIQITAFAQSLSAIAEMMPPHE